MKSLEVLLGSLLLTFMTFFFLVVSNTLPKANSRSRLPAGEMVTKSQP